MKIKITFFILFISLFSVTMAQEVVIKDKKYGTMSLKKKESLNLEFSVSWYSYDFETHNPIVTGQIFPPNVRLRPIKTESSNNLFYKWEEGLKVGDEIYKQFITIAEASATIEAGLYELSVCWNDAVRIYIDGKPVIVEWNSSKKRTTKAVSKKLDLTLSGNHHFLVEHVAQGNGAALILNLKKVEAK
ncbi:MAG: hypothetical protein EPO57_02315 [Chitinophagaceae bacterium]|nr:MAG: hypothetical protein EPO57_02315 [Chitinophagaceae bacterium]